MKILNCSTCGGKASIPESVYQCESLAIVVCEKCGRESTQYAWIKDAVKSWNYLCITEHCMREISRHWETPGVTVKQIAKAADSSYYMARKYINRLINCGWLKIQWHGGCNENGPVRPMRFLVPTSMMLSKPLYRKIDKQETEKLKESFGISND